MPKIIRRREFKKMAAKIKRYHVPTSEGWKLSLKRYVNNAPAVIICHGLASNSSAVDFGRYGSKKWKKYSMAAALHENFDVWVVDLRGRKGSKTFDERKHPGKYTWDVDTYIEHDMPDIINFVRKRKEKEGGSNIFWVGKSMGGMIAYAYGEKHKNMLDGVVTIASPVAFENTRWRWFPIREVYPRKISFPINILKAMERLELMDVFVKNLVNMDNVDEKIFDEYVKKAMDNTISSRVLSQFAIFINHKNFCRYPEKPWMYDLFSKIPWLRLYFEPYSYKYNLNKFEYPLLAIAGSKDETAPPSEIKYAYNHVGSKEKKYLEFPNGHADMNIGNNVEEIYGKINDWILSMAK